jgi:hypothetical protein
VTAASADSVSNPVTNIQPIEAMQKTAQRYMNFRRFFQVSSSIDILLYPLQWTQLELTTTRRDRTGTGRDRASLICHTVGNILIQFLHNGTHIAEYRRKTRKYQQYHASSEQKSGKK